jgi:alpha(1,3/1,4) fucosyltransferase
MKKLILLISVLFRAIEIFAYDRIEVVSHSRNLNLVPEKFHKLNSWSNIKQSLLPYGYYFDNFDKDKLDKKYQKLFSTATNEPIKAIIYNNLTFYKDVEFLQYLKPAKLILIQWEPPTVIQRQFKEDYLKYFDVVLTWDDDLIDNKKFFKFYYPVCYSMSNNRHLFNQKKLCCMIARNKKSNYENEIYSVRKEAIEFFEEKNAGEFDLYGRKWDVCGYKNYKGEIKDKNEYLKKYKFSICFENTHNINGYVTEKIFDCFHSGVIPIYYGATNITDYVPEDCFVDFRKFSNYEDLYVFMRSMTKIEYEIYIENIKKFLKSDMAKLFTKKNFEKTVVDVILKTSVRNY